MGFKAQLNILREYAIKLQIFVGGHSIRQDESVGPGYGGMEAAAPGATAQVDPGGQGNTCHERVRVGHPGSQDYDQYD